LNTRYYNDANLHQSLLQSSKHENAGFRTAEEEREREEKKKGNLWAIMLENVILSHGLNLRVEITDVKLIRACLELFAGGGRGGSCIDDWIMGIFRLHVATATVTVCSPLERMTNAVRAECCFVHDTASFLANIKIERVEDKTLKKEHH
jgi:hypothetical protein